MNQEIAPLRTKKSQKLKVVKAPFLRLQKKISSSPYSYLAYCFFIPVIVMYLIYLAREIHPFGDGSVLVLDLNGQYVYFFEALREAILGDGSLLYSFSRALGGEFVGIYAYYLASPLSYLVALFPQERMLEALLTIILLKVGFCGLSFGFYLHKNSKHPNKLAVIAFSLMYSLCAFAVVHQNNLMWTDALIWLPLLVYGIEQLIKRRKYKLYVVSLSMILMSNYYIGFMVCIFSALYFFYYLFGHRSEETNLTKEKAHRIMSFLRFVFFSLLGAAIAGFILCGAAYSLTFGKDTFSNPSWAFESNFEILDFLTKFFPGSYDTVRPEGLPFVYCGLLTLLLVPVYFLAKKIPSREKVASVLLIGIFTLSFIIKPLDLIWHGFARPNWLNYRYSFMLCFFLLVLAYKGLGNLRRVGEKLLFGTAAMIIFLVAVCEKQEFKTYVESSSKLLTMETVWLTILVTIAFVILLSLLIRRKHPKKRENIMGVLAAVVCIEIFCSSLTCVLQFNKDVIYSGYKGYNSYLAGARPIINRVLENDKGFYRTEKVFYRKSNDNMALSIRGLSNSTSTLNSDTIAFLNKMGYDSKSHVAQYIGGTAVSDSLLGIKYIFDNVSSDKLTHLYEQIDSDELYAAYKNPYALSIAYGVDSSIRELNLAESKTFFERMNVMVGTMLGDKDSAEIFKKIDNSFSYKNVSSANSSSSRYVLSATSDSSGEAFFRLTVPRDGELYFYAPGYYSSASGASNGAKLFVNGESKGDFLGSNTNRVIHLGWYEKGEEIEISLGLRKKGDILTLYKGYDSVWSLDQETFEAAFAALQSNPQYLVDNGCSDDHLTGSITTRQQNQTIQTTIPYDKGWNIYVDGKKVDTYETMEALIAFDIEEIGEHTLEMKYHPTVYTFGTILSISGIIFFICICILELVLRKMWGKKKAILVPDTLLWSLEDFDGDAKALRKLPRLEHKKNFSFKILFNTSLKPWLDKLRQTKDARKESKNKDSNEATTEDQSNDDHGGT